jgi:hypothetical protein
MKDRVNRPLEQLVDGILVIDCESGSAMALEKYLSLDEWAT